MFEFKDKIIRGEKPNIEDWNKYLIEAHNKSPSMTPVAFASYKSKNEQNSYEILSNEIDKILLSRDQKDISILDLACGDGFLIQYLTSKLREADNIVGIDMSEGELRLARMKYEVNSNIKFYQAKAQNIPLFDNSIDAIICHMAFMLMLPIEPVVSEIHRVLKSGGFFSAVIGNAREKQGFFNEILKITYQFIDFRYPLIREIQTGDSRVQNEKGLKELFAKDKGFNGSVDIDDFSLMISTGPQGVWDLIKEMYFVSMLPSSDQIELEKEIKNYTLARANTNKMIDFEFQMRKFSVFKD